MDGDRFFKRRVRYLDVLNSPFIKKHGCVDTWLYCDAQGNGVGAEEVDVADVDNRLVQHVTSVLTDFIQLASTPQQEELSISQVCSVCAPAFLRDRHSDGSRNTIRFRYHIQSL